MFERFADSARRVVVLAQEEARRLDHNYIGTEHILLGLIHEGDGVAAKALGSLGVELGAARAMVEEIIGRGEQTPSGDIPFTVRSKKVLELSFRESLELGHDYIGTEHILLGLAREGKGVAARMLKDSRVPLAKVRERVLELARETPAEPPAPLSPLSRLGPPVQAAEVLRRLDELAAKVDAVIDRLESIERHLGGPDASGAPPAPT